jgi:cytidine deaminase
VLENNERRLVEVATAAVESLPPDSLHSVAAAAMDTRGEIFTGVNVYHFSGGPCAELVAVGAAAAANAGPLITVVAVGDRARGVLAPCGRCRQLLLDLHPDVFVIVPMEDGELVSRPVRDLLPYSYSPSGVTGSPRLVYFHPRHHDSIASGRETTTIRHGDRIAEGPAVFVFDDGETVRSLDAYIDRVESRCVGHLAADDASAVRRRYPDLDAEDTVEVATFRVAQRS